MRTVFYISVIALGSLTNALGALLPRGVSDVSQTPEGDSACQGIAPFDGAEPPGSGRIKGRSLNSACNTPRDGDHALERRIDCASPERDTCTFYESCLEAQTHCGAEGYALAYGKVYCNKFAVVRDEFSDRGKVWLSNTMYCLQKELVPYATGERTASCDEIRKFAFATHPTCYVKSGVCLLPPSDWQVIFDTVGFLELFDSVDAFLAAIRTVGGCGAFYFWLIRNHIIPSA